MAFNLWMTVMAKEETLPAGAALAPAE